MIIHHLKHLLSEILVLGIVVLPFAMGIALLVGVGGWILNGRELGIRASGITLGLALLIIPISLRIAFGPDTRAVCDNCAIWIAGRLKRDRQVPAEKRRHPRYPVELPATFFNDRTSGFVRIGNISAGGCKLETNFAVLPGDCGQLLIDVPGYNAPLKVSRASVRWVTGHECGLEFIRVDDDGQGSLNRLTQSFYAGSFGEGQQIARS